MMKKLKPIYLGLFVFIFLPLLAWAANDITVDTGLSFELPSDSSSYTVDTETTVQSFTVNTSNFTFVVEGSSIIHLTSADAKDFSVENVGDCFISSSACDTDQSTIVITCPSNATTHTVTITPSGTCSAQELGGGGSSSGSSSPSSPADSEDDTDDTGSGENGSEESVDEEEEEQEAEETTCPLDTGSAYKTSDDASVYYVTSDCTKRAFKSADMFFTYFDSWNDVETIDDSDLESVDDDNLDFMPYGPNYDPKYGALVKVVDDAKVYLLLGTEKYWITSESVFEDLNYDWGWIEDISDDLLANYTTGSEINYTDRHPNYTIVKYTGSAKVYRLEPDPDDSSKQVKRWVVDMDAFEDLGFRWDRIVTISDDETYTDGENLDSAEEAVEGVKILDSDYQFVSFLSAGSSGKEVEQLQLKLKSLGFFPSDVDVTGYFGAVTQRAVKDFQIAKGIDVVGFVGPATRAALNE